MFKFHYTIRLLLQSIVTLLTTGVIYGWVGLVMMLSQEGRYLNLCANPTSNSTTPIIPTVTLEEEYSSYSIASDWISSSMSTMMSMVAENYPMGLRRSIESSRGIHAPTTCPVRENFFAQVFVSGASANIISYLMWGVVLDYAGPRITAGLGCTASAIGNFLLATSNDTTRNWLLFSYVILGVGGIGVHLSSFNLAGLVPKPRRGLASSIFPGLFNAGSVIYPFLNLFHSMGYTIASIFTVYGTILLILTVVQVLIQDWKPVVPQEQAATSPQTPSIEIPPLSSPSTLPFPDSQPTLELSTHQVPAGRHKRTDTPPQATDAMDRTGSNLTDSTDSEANTVSLDLEEDSSKNSNNVNRYPTSNDSISPHITNTEKVAGSIIAVDVVDGYDLETRQKIVSEMREQSHGFMRIIPSLKYSSLQFQLFSWFFLITVIYVSSHMTRTAFFQGTIFRQLQVYSEQTQFDSNTTSIISTIIAWYPALNFVVFPFGGIMIDRLGFPLMILFSSSLMVLYAGLFLIPNVPMQLITGIIMIVGRTFIMTAYFAVVSNVTGFKTFGVVSGLAMAIGGGLNFISIPFNLWVNSSLHGSYFWPNFIIFIWAIPLLAYPLVLNRLGKIQFAKLLSSIPPSS